MCKEVDTFDWFLEDDFKDRLCSTCRVTRESVADLDMFACFMMFLKAFNKKQCLAQTKHFNIYQEYMKSLKKETLRDILCKFLGGGTADRPMESFNDGFNGWGRWDVAKYRVQTASDVTTGVEILKGFPSHKAFADGVAHVMSQNNRDDEISDIHVTMFLLCCEHGLYSSMNAEVLQFAVESSCRMDSFSVLTDILLGLDVEKTGDSGKFAGSTLVVLFFYHFSERICFESSCRACGQHRGGQ